MKSKPESNLPKPNRRDFARAGAGWTAAGLAAFAAIEKTQAIDQLAPTAGSIIAPGQTILFQGDSITDVRRKRNDAAANSPPALGQGYAWMAAARLLVDHPDDNLKIYNRGVSGNKVYQLAERWQADCLSLKPDVVSVLIGVNDLWHKREGSYDGTVEKYEKDYLALLNRTKAALPKVKLVVCEPFLLRCGHVDDTWFPEFDGYRVAAKKVAQEAGATFVPFQTMFDTAAKIAPPALWAADGVHPTCDGNAFMSHAWLKAVGA
jgi:lysophospholipase L1-like esterase